jgi:hypothetical protein
MKRSSALRVAATATLWVSALGAGAAQAAPTPVNSVVIQWNNALLDAITHVGGGPTVSSRALAVAHTCMFDAWAAYDGNARGTQFDVQLRRPARERTLANKRAAISYAAYLAAVDLYPTRKASFDALLSAQGYPQDPSNADLARPAGIANVACGEVLAVRHADGSNQLGTLSGGVRYGDYTGYQPYNPVDTMRDPTYWQPLRVFALDGTPTVQSFVTPHWGRVKPFAAHDFRSYHLHAPPRFGTPEFAALTAELLDFSANLTDTTKTISEYWAYDFNSMSPPGHWNLFAQYVIARDSIGLDGQVKLFFAMNNAQMDAGIISWAAKRKFDYARPITAIHAQYAGRTIRAWGGFGMGTRDIPGAEWMPYQPSWFMTPPFPECVSGHSTFAAAAAEVLKDFTGSDAFGYSATVRAGSSQVEPGIVPHQDITFTWPTFTAAAVQSGLSRRYAGIHFKISDTEGRRVGFMIGHQAWQKASWYFGPAR